MKITPKGRVDGWAISCPPSTHANSECNVRRKIYVPKERGEFNKRE